MLSKKERKMTVLTRIFLLVGRVENSSGRLAVEDRAFRILFPPAHIHYVPHYYILSVLIQQNSRLSINSPHQLQLVVGWCCVFVLSYNLALVKPRSAVHHPRVSLASFWRPDVSGGEGASLNLCWYYYYRSKELLFFVFCLWNTKAEISCFAEVQTYILSSSTNIIWYKSFGWIDRNFSSCFFSATTWFAQEHLSSMSTTCSVSTIISVCMCRNTPRGQGVPF